MTILFIFETTMTRVNISIKNWAQDDRPREKLVLKGRESLSDAELLAIILGSGTRTKSAVELAREVLQSVQNDLNKLSLLTVKDLCKFKGIGPAKAVSVVSAIELSRRRPKEELIKNKVSCSEDIYNLMKPHLQDAQFEQFWIVCLSRANVVLSKHKISDGGREGTIADSKRIFKIALEELSSGLILCHNHPSGQLRPSKADIKLTQKLITAGKVLDIDVLDHLIFANSGYYSFADEGEMVEA